MKFININEHIISNNLSALNASLCLCGLHLDANVIQSVLVANLNGDDCAVFNQTNNQYERNAHHSCHFHSVHDLVVAVSYTHLTLPTKRIV